MGSSKIQFTPGALTNSASGLWSIQFDAAGIAYRVDDAGNAFELSGITLHNLLSGRTDANCHSQAAITGLSSSLAGKENSLGNPTVSGMQLVSTVAGVRSWVTVAGSPRCFDGINGVLQSFGSVGVDELIINWNTEVLKHIAAYTHSTVTNPQNITVKFTGWIALSYHINFESDESARVLVKCWASKNGTAISGTTTYAWMYRDSSCDVATCSLPFKAVSVTTNDIIRIHAEYARNGTVDDLGDSNDDIYIRAGESHISMVELLSPEG